MYLYMHIKHCRYRDNFYGVLLPESPDWLAQAQYIEEALIAARNAGEKVLENADPFHKF